MGDKLLRQDSYCVTFVGRPRELLDYRAVNKKQTILKGQSYRSPRRGRGNIMRWYAVA